MKNTLSYSLVFLLGLSLGYLINVFITNKSYHDLVRENKDLQQQLMTNQEAPSIKEELCAPPLQEASTTVTETEDSISDKTTVPNQQSMVTIPTHDSFHLNPSHKPTPPADAGSVRMNIQHVNTLEDLQDFLKNSTPSDTLALLKSRKDLNQETAIKLNGLFSGQILFYQGKKPKDPTWEIEMAIEGEFQNRNFIGRDEIRIFDSKGKMFSNTKSGSGSRLKHYSLGPDNSILVDIQNGRSYIQIYYFPALERWSGHFFQQKDVGEFEQMGVVHMFKR